MPTDETKNGTKKARQLESYRVDDANQFLTTDNGLLLTNTDDSLKAGERGPTLLEDFHFREKITHFDHERIPERVVHARGFGAHGYFELYESMKVHQGAFAGPGRENARVRPLLDRRGFARFGRHGARRAASR